MGWTSKREDDEARLMDREYKIYCIFVAGKPQIPESEQMKPSSPETIRFTDNMVRLAAPSLPKYHRRRKPLKNKRLQKTVYQRQEEKITEKFQSERVISSNEKFVNMRLSQGNFDLDWGKALLKWAWAAK